MEIDDDDGCGENEMRGKFMSFSWQFYKISETKNDQFVVWIIMKSLDVKINGGLRDDNEGFWSY